MYLIIEGWGLEERKRWRVVSYGRVGKFGGGKCLAVTLSVWNGKISVVNGLLPILSSINIIHPGVHQRSTLPQLTGLV